MLKPLEDSDMATQSSLGDRVRSSVCFQSLLGFFFNKGVRGGPRVLLNLAGVLIALFIFVKLLPQRMTESALSAIPIPESVWSSLGGQSDSSVPGGLRIVVFGEIDIGTPVGADQEIADSKSWTQALCDQLACDSHISMVPSPDAAAWSLSSNDLYSRAVDKVLAETANKQGLAQDYSHLTSTYQPQWKSSDLKEQVDKFLAMPKPRGTPGSTLWVFSFGMWDVWSLSALPVNFGKDAVGDMTKDIFAQIERLYAASMDPKSIAYSDINGFIQKSAEEAARVEKEEEAAREGGQVEARDSAEEELLLDTEIQQPEEAAPTEESAKPADSFRILIPRIMDPSVLPGWRELRPLIAPVHSKAEQMRNSAALTSAWNDGIVKALSDWVLKDDPKDGSKDEVHFDTVSPGAAPAPTRDGYAYNLADYVLRQILERQMLNAHQSDANGHGQGSLDDGYRDVRNPCLQPISTVGVSVSTESDVTLNIPNKKIEGDKQMPVQPTPPADAAAAPAKRDEMERKAALAYMDTARACDIPSDHLFYTPFALSQRAIQEVAAETVEMIRSGESVRVRLSS